MIKRSPPTNPAANMDENFILFKIVRPNRSSLDACCYRNGISMDRVEFLAIRPEHVFKGGVSPMDPGMALSSHGLSRYAGRGGRDAPCLPR